jgi:N-acyl-D-amino-acid deacylase
MLRIGITLLIVVAFIFTSCENYTAQEYDLLIKNATIIDGTGEDAIEGDLVVHNGMIVMVGEFDRRTVRPLQTIDAEGKVVSPGFIDTHSHGNPIDTPRFDNFLSMGVTTISLGQDGRSPGTQNVHYWMKEVDAKRSGPNIIHFIGHNSLRRHVNAPRESGLDSKYITEMQEIIREAMELGSFGLTTGLEYDHGSFADIDELIALAEPVSEYGGLIMSHMRSEDDDKIEDSLRELIEQGRGSGAQVHASHLKIVYGNDPSQADQLMKLMSDARSEGVQITGDVYPYVASYTGIGIVFPSWALPPNDYHEVVTTRRDELAQFLRNRVNRRNGPEATLFGTEPWAGMTLAEVAEELDKPFEDVLIDDIGPRGAGAAYFVMNEDVMQRFLTDPNIMVSSDGSPTMRHPRGYGAFAKIIRNYVNELELLSLEEAIHKMAGLPAETLGLTNPLLVDRPRGLIREGFAADILIFDPAEVRDNATFEDPHTYAEGFDWVFVNGIAVIEEGERNDLLPSGVLRRSITVNSDETNLDR